ncbi:hypothetical protein LOTGIDRAFT_129381 [Lottia gigantea]|uniref:GRIP domain-containing protein n=1 Tax=Lottia gigantea TaxID=225164 RepID=V3ZUR5_LOTGI|nr:hypothetical protein LOTGIDRAFT_129381 [Lottia gigantea]ESO86320.1 hypothetical protein LOTGIDRAFT_129381 [Lottia gigantea]
MQIGELSGEKQRLQDKLRSINDGHQRTMKSLESRNQTLQDDLDITRSELTAIQTEFDSYKVRAHSVLKQQKNKPSQDMNSDIEKEEKLRLEKAVDQLKTKLQESSDKMTIIQQDSDILQEEYERLLQRHNKLLADMEEKASNYKRRLEILTNEKSKSILEQQDTIKQLTIQNDSLATSYKDQLKMLQEDHSRSLLLLQKQCDTLDLENMRLQRELQQIHQQRRSTEHYTEPRESPQEFFMDARGEERQEGEAYTTDSYIFQNTVQGNNTGLSFEQLLTTPDLELGKLSKKPEEVNVEMLQTTVTTAHKRIEHLTEVLNESEASVMRLTEQAKILKDEIRRLERNQEREQETKNLEYLKNIFIKVFFLQPKSSERHQLIPVLTQMLKLSAEEKDVLLKMAGNEEEANQAGGWGSYLHRWSGLS